MVAQRADLFGVFLAIPAGFLRALAAKQVQVDEDADSDADSDAGDLAGGDAPPQQQQQPEKDEAQKVGVVRGGGWQQQCCVPLKLAEADWLCVCSRATPQRTHGCSSTGA
jgi:hypothetical protein